jgi:hypothetical protein
MSLAELLRAKSSEYELLAEWHGALATYARTIPSTQETSISGLGC